jgi:hypothetical protein
MATKITSDIIESYLNCKYTFAGPLELSATDDHTPPPVETLRIPRAVDDGAAARPRP